MNDRDALLELLVRLSLERGDFVLASGRRSSYLVDVKRTALHPPGARVLGRVLCAAVRRHFPSAQAVGGRTLGADPLALTTVLASLDDGGPVLEAFIVRKEPKGHGTAQLIEASGGLALGARVVVLEDVVTTGGSAMHAVRAVAEAGYSVLGVLGLVDREEGGRERFAEAGLAFAAVLTATELLRDAG